MVPSTNPWFPTRDEILTFIKNNPDKSSKRDVAKAFGVKGQDRITLKRMLKELVDEGLIEGNRKKFSTGGDLPNVFLMDIVERDSDGELLAVPAKWSETSAPPKILIIPSKQDKGPAAGIGQRILGRLQERDETEQRAATIIKILDKSPSSILGVVRFGAHAGALPRLLPVDRKQRELDIDGLANAQDGDLVEAKRVKFGKYGDYRAQVLAVIGSLKSEKAISQIALHEHDIPHIFHETVLEEAENVSERNITQAREDWRDMPLITIDPADAKDHDDAVFAEADPDHQGGFIVTIAIADVSFYVRPGSALDNEAELRGNSVYFPDRVVPMLPERISNDLCSLKEHQDRPAIAMKIWLDHEGKKRKHRLHRILMRSHGALSYDEAQQAIDGKPSKRAAHLLETSLRPLWAAYTCLKQDRDKRAPLDLDIAERRVKLDDQGRVQRVITPVRLDAHRLIEEFMILANVAAAEALEERKSPLIYRAHDAPSLAKLEALRDFLSTIDQQLPKSGNIRPHHFNRILHHVKDENHALLTNQVILRSQAQAEYTPENFGHFGLNLQRYAHFTSPIRRYADLVVHRALVSSFKLGEGGLGDVAIESLGKTSEHISMTERRAMKAERSTIDRLIAEWLSEQVGARFWGHISGVTKAGLFITLDDSGADGFIPISTLANDYFHYDETRHFLAGETSGMRYTMGDHVEVELIEALPFAGALRFEMISEGTEGKPVRHAFPKPKGRRRHASKGKTGGAPKGISRKIKRKR